MEVAGSEHSFTEHGLSPCPSPSRDLQRLCHQFLGYELNLGSPNKLILNRQNDK